MVDIRPPAGATAVVLYGANGQALDDSNGAVRANTGGLSAALDSVLARLGIPGTVSNNSMATATSSTVVQSYTVPTGSMAYCPMMSLVLLAGTAPVMRPRRTPNLATVEILDQITPTLTTRSKEDVNLYCNAGDVLDWFVSTGGAGSSISAYISALQTALF